MLKTAKKRLIYDPKTGSFTWKVRVGGNGCIKPGTKAGSKRGNGSYTFIKIDNKWYRAHQLAWLFMYGRIPAGYEIDHINGKVNDNRIVNLRLATHQQNIVNGKHRKNNTSGKKGVTFHAGGRWRAKITKDGRTIHLGLYDSVGAAHYAYMSAARKLFGDFARAH